jgi:hypothetical protein
MRPSSSEDEKRSNTGTCLEGPTCSNTDEHGQREETSGGDPSGDGEPKGVDDGVGTLFSGLPSSEGEQACLVPLLFSMDGKRGQEE